jgi:tetratricopeptide (TPR) repeat protein
MRKLLCFLSLVAALSVAVPAVLADDEAHHHEDLTQAQLGTVHFPVSCTPAAQQTFERGVALLHSFWYEEAEKTFAEVQTQDPQCSMAYWGEAMSLWHQLWNRPDATTIKSGAEKLAKASKPPAKTARERDYIAASKAFYSTKKNVDHEARAQAYSAAMKKVYAKYPDDHEAAAFYALSLIACEPDNDTTFANRKEAGAILEKLFAVEPDHPGIAHYLIHTYDKPQLAQLGLPAARRYAQIAPAAPHALHMPSHIFARLGLWEDDIDSNLASIAATRKTAAMHMGGEGHQFHAMDYLVTAYLQSGREADAWKVIEEVRSMPAMKDTMYGTDFDPRIYALVTFPARYDLELHRWPDAASLELVAGANVADNSTTYLARAIGAARSGSIAQARANIDQIDAVHKTLVDQKKKGVAEVVDQDRKVGAAWLDHAESRNDTALASLRAIAEKQEASGGESDGGIPAREMLADMLLEMKQPEKALAEYKTELKFYPNRFNGLYGAAQAAEIAGQSSQAAEYYALLVKNCDGSNSTRPELAKAKQSLLAEK